MFKDRKITIVIFSLISIFLLGILKYALTYVIQAIPIASAYNAKILCSSTFVSKRNPEDIINTDLSQFFYVSRSADLNEKSATASVLGLGKRKAIYREGLGCTLAVDGVSEDDLRNQFKDRILPKPEKSFEWQDISKSLPETINKEKLDKAIDKAFEESNPKLQKITRAVIVINKGKIIAERYAPGINKDTPLLGWSMTKSIINAFMGILEKQGKLNTNAKNLFSEWKNDERKNISIDDLMKMSSGLEFNEEYGSISDATKMLFTQKDTAEYAINKPLINQPGTKWSYSSGTTNILSKIARDKIGEKDYLLFPYKELFYKIGMNSAVIEPDASGTFVGSSFTYATARDWAKFGQLYLQNGIWNDQKIFNDNWVKYTTTPAKNSPQSQYGAQIWLNAGERWKGVPKDVYNTQGFEGQSVVICPSYDTVIVRLGLSKKADSWNTGGFVYDILSSINQR